MKNKEEARYQKIQELLSSADEKGKIGGRSIAYVFEDETGESYKTARYYLTVMNDCVPEVINCVRAEKISIQVAMRFRGLDHDQQRKTALEILESTGSVDHILKAHNIITDADHSRKRLKNSFSSICKADFDDKELLSVLQELSVSGKLDREKLRIISSVIKDFI